MRFAFTLWMEWFFGCLGRAMDGARLEGVPLNQRQRLILNRLLDGFASKLTTSQHAKLAKCSQATAQHELGTGEPAGE